MKNNNKEAQVQTATEPKKLSKMGEYLRSGKPLWAGVEYDISLVLR